MSHGASAGPGSLFDALVARYGEPHRAYHNLTHIEECFRTLDLVAHRAERLGEIEMALWFHDAIYDTRSHTNEADSAAWARRALTDAGVRDDGVARPTLLEALEEHVVLLRLLGEASHPSTLTVRIGEENEASGFSTAEAWAKAGADINAPAATVTIRATAIFVIEAPSTIRGIEGDGENGFNTEERSNGEERR